MYPVTAHEEDRLSVEQTTAKPRNLWGLLTFSLTVLVLVALAAPQVRRQSADASVSLPTSPPVAQARGVQKRANLPAYPTQPSRHLIFVPMIAKPDPGPPSTHTPTPTSTITPTARAARVITPTATPTATFSPTPTPTPTPTPPPTPDGQTRSVRLPILMYHYVSEPPPDADAYRQDLSVTPENFEGQLRYLIENGYTTITLKELIYHLTLGRPLPERPVILTFDDGYRDNFLQAYRLLRRYDSVGTFFVVTGFIDENRPEYLTWGQVRVMHRGGMAFGSHSYTHPDLRGQEMDYLVWQILGSQQALAERIGEPVRFFSYPAGSYDRQVIDVLRSAGFWAAVTTQQGTTHTSDGLFELARVRVRGDDTLDDFAAKLNRAWEQGTP
jgi:peptidoglycan/xylan/chitin deacetylase (PgdA/CDA1 family)